MSLEEWSKKFGGEEGLDPFASSKRQGFDWKLMTAYLVRIKKATLVYRPSNRNEQLRLNIEVLETDDTEARVIGEAQEHVDLPFQASDAKIENREKRQNILSLRTDTLKKILSAAMPSRFGAYDKTEADPVTQKKVYLDFEGRPLTNGRYEERQNAINENVMEALGKLKDSLATKGEGAEVEELDGVYLYIYKKPNRKTPEWPYSCFTAIRPAKVPMFSGDEETPF